MYVDTRYLYLLIISNLSRFPTPFFRSKTAAKIQPFFIPTKYFFQKHKKKQETLLFIRCLHKEKNHRQGPEASEIPLPEAANRPKIGSACVEKRKNGQITLHIIAIQYIRQQIQVRSAPRTCQEPTKDLPTTSQGLPIDYHRSCTQGSHQPFRQWLAGPLTEPGPRWAFNYSRVFILFLYLCSLNN